MRRYILLLFILMSVISFSIAQTLSPNIEQALKDIEEYEYACAIKKLEMELKQNSENQLVVMGLLGYANYGNGNYAKAMSLFDQTIECGKGGDSIFLSTVYYHRAGLNSEIGDTIASIRDYLKAISYEPANDKALTELAEIYFQTNQFDEADNMFLKLINVDSGNPYPYYGLARNAYNQGKFYEASGYIDKASVLDEDKERISLMKVRLGIASENWNEVLTESLKVIAQNSDNEEAYYSILKCSDSIYDESRKKMKEKIVNEPENGVWSFILSHIYIRHGKYDKAILCLNHLQSNEEYRRLASYWIGECYDKLDDQRLVIETMNKAINQDSTIVDYYLKRADALFYEQELDRAEKDYRKIIDLEKEYAYYSLYRLGWIREMQERYNEALDYYNMSILLKEDYAYTYMMKGSLLKDYFNDMDNATVAFKKCIELDNGISEGTCKQYAYLALGDTEKAIEITDSILGMTANPGAYYDAACIYSRMGEREKAVIYLEQAFKKGYKKFKHALNDNDLENLRNYTEFESLLKKMIKVK